METRNKSYYGDLLIHLSFCIVLIFLFGYNCRLRPAAYPALYKEYISGLIVLVAIYTNYCFLFPKLYTCRKYKAYWAFTLLSILLSGFLEILLVSPQLFYIYSLRNLSSSKIIEYVVMDSMYVVIRNGGLVLFSYAISEIQWLQKQTAEKATIVRKQYDSLDVKDENHKTLFINTASIYYCEQERNNTVIYMLEGKKYIRYCSMSALEDLLGENEFVRISRNVIVPKKLVIKFKDNSVELKENFNYKQPVVFKINESYLQKVVNLLSLELKDTTISTDKTEIKEPNSKNSPSVPDIQSLLEVFNQNQKLLTVYHYISTHSNCKISDISDDCKISKGSVSRYLAKLTEHGLISYVGAKKTGGYTITQQKPLTEE